MNKKIMLLLIVGIFILSGLNASGISEKDRRTIAKSTNIEEFGKTIFNNGPEEEWNITFGCNKYDVFFVVKETIDGGFIALGGINADSWDIGGDCLLVKTDMSGNIIWNKSFGGSKTDNGHGIIQTDDGGYIISAITESYGAGSMDAWVIKTDSSGNEEWNRTFGGNYYDLIEKSIAYTPDGGYILVGSTYSFGNSNNLDGWLIKIDGDGNELWNKTYGTKNKEHLWEVQITSDGGYVMIGYVDNSSTHRRDAWVVKTDGNGDEQWNKKFGPAYQGLSIKEAHDGGYVFLSEKKDSEFGGYLNAWMVKIDKYGNEEWNKTFITPKGEDCFAVHHYIQKTLDNSYIVAGVTNAILPVYSVGDMWISKIDENGNILWEKIIGGKKYDTTYTVDITSDGGFVASGMTESYGSGADFNAWLVKVSDYENQRPNKPSKPKGSSVGKTGKNYTFKSSATEPDEEKLYYIWDWDDKNYSFWLGPYESGETAEETYSWKEKGERFVRVKVKDIYGGESEWSDPFKINIPRDKMNYLNLHLFDRLFERFPNAYLILRYLIRL